MENALGGEKLLGGKRSGEGGRITPCLLLYDEVVHRRRIQRSSYRAKVSKGPKSGLDQDTDRSDRRDQPFCNRR